MKKLLLFVFLFFLQKGAFCQYPYKAVHYTTSFETCDATMTTDLTTGSSISVTSTASPNSGSRNASLAGGCSGATAGCFDASFITPAALTFVPGRVYTVTFWAVKNPAGLNIINSLKICKSTTNTNAAMKAATGSDIIFGGNSSIYSSYVAVSGSFTVSSAETKYVGIQCYFSGLGGGAGTGLYIDDVTISSTCLQCSNGVQDAGETSVDCGGSVCLTGAPTGGSLSPTSNSFACGGGSFTLCLSGSSGTIQWQMSTDNSTWYDIANANNTTYTGNATQTSYFRAKVTNDGCGTLYSNTYTATITGLNTRTASVSGNWSSTTTWGGSSVPTSCTDVTVNAGVTVTADLNTAPANCHNLTINSGGQVMVTFKSGTFLSVYGSIVNNSNGNGNSLGGIQQSAESTTQGQGNSSGIQLMGAGATWGGSNNAAYDKLTIRVGDGSYTFMTADATINFLDATKTSVVGNLALGSNTLKITKSFFNSGSTVNVNTGLLWLAITSSMSIDQDALFPNYGTVFFDTPGGSLTGNWSTIGGTGFYNLWQRSQAATALTNNCNHRCRNDFVIVAGGGGGGVAMGTYTLQVEGDFENNSTFTPGNSTVLMQNMDAKGVQNIQGTSQTTFYNLKIDNQSGASNGVYLNSTNASPITTVSNVLTLTNGPLKLNSQRLVVSNAATAAVTRTNGYVVSETNPACCPSTYVNPSVMQWNMGSTTGIHEFPFGTADGYYIPVRFNNNGNTSGNVSISTRPTSNTCTTPSGTAGTCNQPWAGTSNVAAVTGMDCPALNGDCSIHSVIDRWWDIQTGTNPVGGTGVTLSLSYMGRENTINTPGQTIGFQHWNGSLWNAGTAAGTAAGTYVSSGTAGGTSANTAYTVTGTSNFTYFSPYILVGINTNFPLPVELLSFTAECENEMVLAEWETASEQNSDYFTLEKSTDGTVFYPVANVKAAGNSSTRKKYSVADTEPFSASAYYRLSETDLDGGSQTFDMIAVRGCGSDDITAFSTGSQVTVTVNAKEASHYNIALYDAHGKVVLERKDFFPTGKTSSSFEVPAGNGVYFMKICNSQNLRNQKISIQK